MELQNAKNAKLVDAINVKMINVLIVLKMVIFYIPYKVKNIYVLIAILVYIKLLMVFVYLVLK